MTREEAINVLQKYTDTESGISKVVAEAHEMAIRALEQEPKAGWIPVSERLPESDGEYLVLYDWGDDCYKCEVLRYVTKPNELLNEGWNNIGAVLNKMVDWSADMIAWMPLPEPYKEG